MAASKEDDFSEQRTDFLTCSICLEQYKEPLTLNCLHTFCQVCLEKYSDKNNVLPGQDLKCPLCRDNTQLPTEGICALKSNFHVKEMLEYIKCHRENREKPMNDIPLTTKYPQCEVHNKACELYCQSKSCGTFICIKCITSHSGHDIIPTDEKVQGMKQLLKSAKGKILNLLEDLDKRVQQSDEEFQEVRKKEDAMHKTITKILEDIIIFAEARAEVLKMEASRKVIAKKETINRRRIRCQSQLMILQSAIDKVNALMSADSADEIVSVGVLLLNRCEQLLSSEEDTDPLVQVVIPKECDCDIGLEVKKFEKILEALSFSGEIGCIKEVIETEELKDDGKGISVVTENDLEKTFEKNFKCEEAEASSSAVMTSVLNLLEYKAKSDDDGHLKGKLCKVTSFKINCGDDLTKPGTVRLCFGPDDILAASDMVNKQVKIYNMNGTLLNKNTYRFNSHPRGIAWCPSRNAFILAVEDIGFCFVSPRGRVSWNIGKIPHVADPIDVAVLSDGSIAALHDMNEVAVFSDKKKGKMSWNVHSGSLYLTSSGGKVIVSNEKIFDDKVNAIEAYSRKGNKLWSYKTTSPGCSHPDYLGHILMCDLKLREIVILDEHSGKFRARICLYPILPYSIAVSQTGLLAVWDEQGGEMHIYENCPNKSSK